MSDRILTDTSRRLFAATVAVLVWMGLLFTQGSERGMREAVAQQYCPDIESPRSLEPILENPEEYIGCKVLVEGVLEKEESDERTIYSIDMGQERTFQIWPWAPDENDRSQRPGIDASNLQPMSSYVGRKLRILGHLVKERSGRIVIEASIIEEVNGGDVE